MNRKQCRLTILHAVPLLGLLVAAPANAETETERDHESASEGATKTQEEDEDDVDHDKLLHGFRVGYMFLMNIDAAYDPFNRPNGESLRKHYQLTTAHELLLGYEVTWRMVGHDWLNVLLVGNASVAGIEQSRFFPSFNALLGFELNQSFQVGVGVTLSPTKDRIAHMVLAAGWTPRVGGFYVPLHLVFIPDVYMHHRIALTTGVNW